MHRSDTHAGTSIVADTTRRDLLRTAVGLAAAPLLGGASWARQSDSPRRSGAEPADPKLCNEVCKVSECPAITYEAFHSRERSLQTPHNRH